MRLGVHVSIAGGMLEAVARATRLSCTTMQIFSRSPRGGPAPRLRQADGALFDEKRRAAGIAPLAVHNPYFMNLAAANRALWSQSVRLYGEEYTRASRLRADYLVTHVGSAQGQAAGVKRVAKAIDRTLDRPRRPVMILLENTAGSGQGLGARFEELAAIRDRIQARASVGVCLDTAHLFAAGYPIHTAEGLERVLALFDRIVGLEQLKVIHLNDSKVPFDSRVDRHWHIGQGEIGLEAFRRIVNHPRLCEVPFILETPKRTEREDQRNLKTVRTLVDASGRSRRAQVVVR